MPLLSTNQMLYPLSPRANRGQDHRRSGEAQIVAPDSVASVFGRPVAFHPYEQSPAGRFGSSIANPPTS